MPVYFPGHSVTEFFPCGLTGEMTEIISNKEHTVAAVLFVFGNLRTGFACTSVNDSDEVICDNDSVLAGLLSSFSYYLAFQNIHDCLYL